MTIVDSGLLFIGPPCIFFGTFSCVPTLFLCIMWTLNWWYAVTIL